MRRLLFVAAAAALAAGPIGLFACSERQQPEAMREQLRAFEVSMPKMAEAPAMEPPSSFSASPPNPLSPPAALPGTVPRIAYVYGYRFRLPAAAIAPLQERYLALCRRMGEARCRVVAMRRGEAAREERDESRAAAAMELQVAAPVAERFGRALTASAGEAGGETVDREISAEDLSRSIVDSEARIRTRETLIRRLSSLLDTRSGNIQQAVEAERAINQAQEELDAARTWLAEMRGRVAMSTVRIAYDSAGPVAARAENPLTSALARVGAVTVQSLAVILLVAGALAPWALIALGIFLVARWYRRRFAALASEPGM